MSERNYVSDGRSAHVVSDGMTVAWCGHDFGLPLDVIDVLRQTLSMLQTPEFHYPPAEPCHDCRLIAARHLLGLEST